MQRIAAELSANERVAPTGKTCPKSTADPPAMHSLLKLGLACLASLSALPLHAATPHAIEVLYFGDSLTFGAELGAQQQKTNRWPAVVEQLSGGRFKEINEGKGGRPTDSFGDFLAALKRHPHPGILVIALGGNDARDTSGNAVTNAITNIRRFITHARTTLGPDTPIVLGASANINPQYLVATKSIAPQRDKNLRDLAAAYEKLAGDTGCAFVSFYGLIPPESLKLDGVHPDASGHAIMAKTMLAKLQTLVPAE